MANISEIFRQELKVINIGLASFKDPIESSGVKVVQVDWTPPAWGDPALGKALFQLESRKEIPEANARAIQKVIHSKPVLIDLGVARDVIPGMDEDTILHAGPPITWERMSGPMKGAVIGALIYEGRAKNPEEAEILISSGRIRFSPCHEHGAVGPMAGIISASMPVFVVRNETYGNTSYCTQNEGLGKVLRYGAYSPEVIERLKWMEKVLAPVLREAIRLSGGIDLKAIMAQAVQMGDECHNRNKAGTTLFIRAVAPYLIQTKSDSGTIASVLKFISSNDHFFLNLSMPAQKSAMDAAHGEEWSTLVTTMARNGTEFGIRISGLPGEWFTGLAQKVKGLYFPGYGEDDANPDIGDSAITETSGLGGFAMAGAPAIVRFVGGTPQDALGYTNLMYEITLAENRDYLIPALDFRGTPTGIDLLAVVGKSLLPIINTGIAHKKPGVGQVGAGLVNPPKECFVKALEAMAQRYLGTETKNEVK